MDQVFQSVKMVNIGVNKWYQYINLAKTKRRYCGITVDKEKCVRLFPNTHIFGSCVTDKRGTDLSSSVSLLDIVVLMIYTLPSSNTNTITERVWEEYMYEHLKSCKPNLMVSYNHHFSSEYCFSFGNKPL